MITPTQYQREALRTLYPDLTERDILNLCGLGMNGEIGEVTDLLKKYLWHRNGKPLDVEKVKDEMGDVFWYISILLSTLGLTFEDVMQASTDKLRARHPDGFVSRYESDSGVSA